MAQEKTEGWLMEAAHMSTSLELHSPVLQCCICMVEEFRSYLPLLTKLGSLQLQNFQALLRGVFWVESGLGEVGWGDGGEERTWGLEQVTALFPAAPVGNTFPPWVAPCLVPTGTNISSLLHHLVGPLCCLRLDSGSNLSSVLCVVL